MPMAVPPLRLRRVLVVATVVVACAAVGRAVDIADFVAPRSAGPPPAEVPGPVAAPPAVAVVVEPAPRPVSLRIQWGGGKPQAWTGSIAIVAPADAAAGAGEPLVWRTLCTEPDAAAMAHAAGDVIQVHERRPLSGEGIEVEVPRWRHRRLLVTLQPMGTAQPPVTLDVVVEDALAAPVQKALDGEGNRITVRQSPGDALRTTLVAADAGPLSQVCRPGQRVRVAVDPLLAVSGATVPVELRMRLESGATREPAVAQDTLLVPVAEEQPAAAGRRAVRYAQVVFDVDLPAVEGVYDVALEAVERGSLRWARPVASRRLQLVALDDAPQPPPVARDGAWQLLHEVDPGSPRLHERLRRLPGVGLPGVALPSMPLPAMPLPSFTRPSLPVPDVPLPSVPRLPGVSIPSMATMVPRFNGLLTHGHSRVEPHPLGPVFRLPPAAADGVPSWEGIVVANAQPGMPHAVEIEYPTDQDATFAACVFEADAAAAAVEQRHAGGFVVRPEAYVENPPRLAVHRFVFWPTTKTPLVVVANTSPRGAAAFGRVRVLVGPTRLPAPPEPAGLATTAGRRSRRPVYGILRSPRFAGDGGSERDLGGRTVADWSTHVAGIEHEAERLVARGAAGGLVTVYADGAAAWPTTLTRHAPRWNPEATVENTVDATPKDLLAALCRVHARAGLRLVPALEFDAPLPALEAVVAQGGRDAVGVVCVGRDGKPAETAAGPRYNILDPRVQEGVVAVVRDVAERVRGVPCVAGIGLVMADDGWLHLPGPDWALDDATFGRFLASVGASEPAATGDRFAQRAELVQGPLRDVWLEWRADEIAAFHSRLADVVTAADARFSLHLVPTTLFVAGPVANRFQPVLGGEARDAELLRELGLDPLRSTRHRSIVFGVANVHAADGGLREQGMRTAANRAPGVIQASAAAARRSLVLVEQPQSIDLSAVLPHGPFGAAAAPDAMLARGLATGVERDRRLAEAGFAGDAEIVFDETLLFETPAQSDGEASRHAYEMLPAVALETRAPVRQPMLVRSAQSGGATWVHVTNAGAAPARAIVEFDAAVGAVVDATSLSPLPTAAATVAVELPAWGSRTLVIDGQMTPRTVAVGYTDAIGERIVARVASLRARRAQLEAPASLEVLDNPGFEMGGPAAAAAARDSVAGWELVESRRGALRLVSAAGGGQAVGFSSTNGLATLRSNPFPPPATGRVSVAVRLRIDDGEPQPPLRIALEGVQDDGEYYRFAVVGGHGGGRPLGPEWSLFVLQVDDLPPAGVDSLRVRFDLLGPGSVQIDDVRVFDLAFDERQRVQLSRSLGLLEQRLRTADLGGCLVDLEGYWPAFLEAFVAEAAAVVAEPVRQQPAAPQRTGGMFDRLKGWWQ